MIRQSAYHTVLPGLPVAGEVTAVAERVFAQVFRSDFSAPGVALVSLGPGVTSRELRALMIALKGELDRIYRRVTGRRLVYLTLDRFNQQVTTKFHLDGAPAESYLMLGYEPTVVPSRISIADYARAAHDWGIGPETLLSDYNPMHADHEQRLRPYVTELAGFDPAESQILLLNNSSASHGEGGRPTLGVMHQATILTSMPHENRIVNSTMIGSADGLDEDAGERSAKRAFVETPHISGYVNSGAMALG